MSFAAWRLDHDRRVVHSCSSSPGPGLITFEILRTRVAGVQTRLIANEVAVVPGDHDECVVIDSEFVQVLKVVGETRSEKVQLIKEGFTDQRFRLPLFSK
jgi:hypothetical protein